MQWLCATVSGVRACHPPVFNAYGPYQAAQSVLPKFIQNAMTGKPIVINGSGEQIRSYCYS